MTNLPIIGGLIDSVHDKWDQIRHNGKYYIPPQQDSIFQDALNESKNNPVVVEISSNWCQGCKSLNDSLHSIQKDPNENFTIKNFDFDDVPHTVENYGIHYVPATVCLNHGKQVGKVIPGGLKKDVMKFFIDSNFKYG